MGRGVTMSMEEMIVEPPEGEALVDPMSWFDSPGPLEVEIGCGKGGFLVSRAKADSTVRLLGIEWANKYFRYCADRLARWQLHNVRVMRTDAKVLFIRHLPPACVSVLHVYHPDPWPKKRHHKRRLIQPDFLEAAARVIEAEGRLLIQSDHHEYFEQIEALLGVHPAFETVAWASACTPLDESWRGTNFEIKYARAGRSIFRAAYKRAPR